MSLLRTIMRAITATPVPPPSPAAGDSDGALAAYAARLAACSEAMLHYEWHRVEAAIGSDPSLRGQRSLLVEAFQQRSLSPIRPRGAVRHDRHAWELDPELAAAWSIR